MCALSTRSLLFNDWQCTDRSPRLTPSMTSRRARTLVIRPERALTPAAGRAGSTTTGCVADYSFMFRPTNTLRPGAGENIGRALSQKKLSYQA